MQQDQHHNRSTLDVGFLIFVLKCKCNILIIVELVYVQVNKTHEFVQDSLNTITVVVLEVLFYYEIIYEMGPPRLGKQVKESSSRASPPLFA